MTNDPEGPKRGLGKLDYADYLEMVGDPKTPDERIIEYSLIERGASGFDFVLRPDPEKVEMTELQEELESAMAIGNAAARFRRQRETRARIRNGDERPFLVSEGDSWFQFPILIKEVIDHLSSHYTIASFGAAGDTAQNMVFGPPRRGGAEFLTELWRHRSRVQAFLFSAAGNDIIGEDLTTGDAVPALRKILRPPAGANPDARDVVDMEELEHRLGGLRHAYRTVIANVRGLANADRPSHLPPFSKLPIVIHGYDYPFPYPTTPKIGGAPEWRDPRYAKQDQWLGSAFSHHGIDDARLRREVIVFLLDRLYEMLSGLAGDASETGIWLVDCRGALPTVTDWNDEIHGTSDGFRKIATRFQDVLNNAIAPQVG
ncbi:hypothetical protein [Rhodovulum sulfidophilum]|uniref:SGNH hydrolase-type esterase domain-containing protein n=1 Tax=Rhodovulum sulfidophilum TaxID=35806 RepID=A0ABS1RYZ2_RHOSU|nr:hypothetical protein [Rhodovulum sulfidophilum]MBL3611312.1 hypothetical protein [Rhodovulum sulfidophilum]MCE8458383.1 hypothetical protein [Rhodovulum sulfidophilum]